MDKIISTNFTVTSGELKSSIKLQEGFFPFTEKPSDKYYVIEEKVISQPSRINPFDLFSLFTADIIKRRVIFVR